MSFVKSFKLCGMLAFIILLTLHFSENSKAEFVKDFDCIPQAIKTPAQKGLKIVGEMSEFDPSMHLWNSIALITSNLPLS